MNIGLDQFSYHRFYGDIFPWEQNPGVRWKLIDFLDRAKALNINLVGLHSHYLSPAEVERLGTLLARYGFTCILEWGHPDGLKMGTSAQAVHDLLHWLAVAEALGSKIVRIVAGYPTWRGREPVQIQINRLVPILGEICKCAMNHGLTLAIENHADFTPLELLQLIERVNHRALLVCFDTGNCVRLGADLFESARLVAPFTAMVHLKDLIPLPTSRGNPNASWPSAPLGRGTFDLPAIIAVMQNNGFNGPWLIELAQMHPDFSDEQTAIEESVSWLKNLEIVHL